MDLDKAQSRVLRHNLITSFILLFGGLFLFALGITVDKNPIIILVDYLLALVLFITAIDYFMVYKVYSNKKLFKQMIHYFDMTKYAKKHWVACVLIIVALAFVLIFFKRHDLLYSVIVTANIALIYMLIMKRYW